jgi:hypothetical protein
LRERTGGDVGGAGRGGEGRGGELGFLRDELGFLTDKKKTSTCNALYYNIDYQGCYARCMVFNMHTNTRVHIQAVSYIYIINTYFFTFEKIDITIYRHF